MAPQPTLYNDQPTDPNVVAAAQSAPVTTGLWVWESNPSGSCWWSPTTGVVPTPPGWEFLPTGDALLTRAVRALGPWWRARRWGYYRTISEVGILAPAVNIEQAAAPLRELRYPRERSQVSSSVEELVCLAAHPDARVRAGVALNRVTPTKLVVDLAKDRDVEARVAVAANPNTPPALLTQLVGAKARKVSDAAARNPSLPEHLRVIVALACV